MASLRQWITPRPLPPWPGYALVQRDLVRSLRRVRPFVFLVILALAQWFFISFIYPPWNLPLSSVGLAGDHIFIAFVMSTLAAGALLLPSSAAVSVAAEREQETHDLVRLTLMRRVTFFIAKTVNAWAYFLLFVCATLPMAGATFFLVGLEVRQVLMTFALLFAASIALTVIGVAMSCRAKHPARALVLAYTVGMFLMGGHVLLLYAFVAAGGVDIGSGGLATQLDSLGEALSPPITIAAIYGGRDTALWEALPYYAVLTAAFAWWGWRGLHRAEKGSTVRGSVLRRKTYRPIPDWANPMAVREIRWGSGMQRRGMWGTRILFGK